MKVLHLSGEGPSLALRLAERAGHVVAIQTNEAALQRLGAEAVSRSVHNVELMTARDLTALPLNPDSVDLIVSCWALDPLQGADKRLVMRQCRRWLRPDGRLVLADRMADEPSTSGEIRPGRCPPKPAVRPGGHTCMGRLKRAASRGPTPSSFWLATARDAGFADVTYVPLQEGAGIMLARKRWETAHSEVE